MSYNNEGNFRKESDPSYLEDKRVKFTEEEEMKPNYRFSTSTVGSKGSRNTEIMASITPNLGMRDSKRLRATPADMENSYGLTDAGKQSRRELNVAPLPFAVATELNKNQRKANGAILMKELRNERKIENRKKGVVGVVVFLLLVGIIIGIIGSSVNRDEEDKEASAINENTPTESPTINPTTFQIPSSSPSKAPTELVFVPTESPTEFPTKTPSLSPTKLDRFISTDKDEIDLICENFSKSNQAAESDNSQFGVCIDSTTLLLCVKEKDGDDDLAEEDCTEGKGNKDDICPCDVGEFIDLRNEDLDKNDICTKEAQNVRCNLFLDDVNGVELRTLL